MLKMYLHRLNSININFINISTIIFASNVKLLTCFHVLIVKYPVVSGFLYVISY